MSRPGPVSLTATTPALLAKLASGGRGFRGAVSYASLKPGSELVWTNLPGEATAQNWSRQVAAFRKLKPNLKRVMDHWSLSLDPRHGKLTASQWKEAVKVFLDDLGYQDCPVVIHRHTDTDVDHAHASVLRIRVGKDGRAEVVSDSNLYRRSHISAEKAARKLGLKALPPREDSATRPAPADAAIVAGKRAKRRGTAVAVPGSVAKAFDSLVGRCTSLDELEARAVDAGLELQVVRKSGGEIQGLNVRAAGVHEWTKASALSRDRSLSWSKVQARLGENADRRARAQASADAANAAARERAAQRVAERLAAQPQQQIQIVPQARALLLVAANQAKEAAMTTISNDKLDFLSRPPAEIGLTARELADRDDAALDGDDAARRDRDRERHNAELALAAELRSATKTQLSKARQSLRSELAAAEADAIARFVTRLTRLVLRIATAGAVVLPPSENERRAFIARQTIEQIDGELRRRADTVGTREVDAFKTKPTSTQEPAKSVQKLQVVRAHDPRQEIAPARQLDAERENERNRS